MSLNLMLHLLLLLLVVMTKIVAGAVLEDLHDFWKTRYLLGQNPWETVYQHCIRADEEPVNRFCQTKIFVQSDARWRSVCELFDPKYYRLPRYYQFRFECFKPYFRSRMKHELRILL